VPLQKCHNFERIARDLTDQIEIVEDAKARLINTDTAGLSTG
jgi:hypothetical protein